MKVTFPYMGTSNIVFKSIMEELGHEVVVKKPSKRTLSLGTEHAPEFACIPFKILLGTYLESLEEGADLIVTSGGRGPCRAGHYAQLQEKILHNLGYDFEMVVFEALTDSFKDFFSNIRKVAGSELSWWQIFKLIKKEWYRLMVLDDIERLTHKVRPRELKKGTTTNVFAEAQEIVAVAKTEEEIKKAKEKSFELLNDVPQDPNYEPLKIGIIGEIYVVLEPFANLELEKTLGEMGVEVDRSIYLTGWTKDHTFFVPKKDGVEEAAKPYLDQLVGGHGLDSVGNTVLYAQNGFDGVIQLAPFTCIPEIVAKSILPEVSKDWNIPFLTIFLDEKTGKAGVTTRLEAFVDLIAKKRDEARDRIS
ncbi:MULTISPECIES: CoA protein activase [unclassified Candidatus Frackibacter]|uniref:CoA protein activase n=1 Tax=unclassified Candidatus Frackibacter TaxID=2648818 RepID=UPI000881DEC4|nr:MULTISPECIES: CoA protein activase [unclassified Candidatus Frackibacter]SDC11302.1 Predicted nucleotide-binding protein, sugar kinase/HSP70/actin superfamily [Candidatus Frackibacter sp. WG11]SEM36567.1 Predicted nucleotide-binding protein, sugar kinase/HSP70/actin superfamily [Candidatus Frackibacter sp. WG12]SFL41871.1 Predicted nucleotide-binding protein, sugar kinase/HSP70/actin superfamily [Candidatus Frackibacter sp. WG13]